MIQIDSIEVYGWEAAIRGMRNPMNSWDKSDSDWSVPFLDCAGCLAPPNTRKCRYMWVGGESCFKLCEADHELMMKLVKGGSVHAKFRRMINVTMDITAPLYWWKEFDTYKVGTVRNSCSTMHKIHSKEFEINDFSVEHLDREALSVFANILGNLNHNRERFIAKPHRKDYWWQMIQLLPSSYNQRATVQLNYEVLANIYKWRKDHKLDEWREFCRIMKEQLPYSELFTGEENE